MRRNFQLPLKLRQLFLKKSISNNEHFGKKKRLLVHIKMHENGQRNAEQSLRLD